MSVIQSASASASSTVKVGFVPFFWVFVVIKAFGSALAAWSWWWLLMPIVPSLFVILGRLGLLN